MKYISILLVALLSISCSTMSNLSPPSQKMHFVLTEDIVEHSKAGIAKTPVVLGLKKGRYDLVGENKNMYFFLPEEKSFFQFMGDQAESFKNGEITTDAYDFEKGFAGGLMYPKNKAQKDASPRIYLTLQSNYENAGARGGAVGVATASLVDGYIVKSALVSFEKFDSIAKIIIEE